jgi:hypothetical protein
MRKFAFSVLPFVLLAACGKQSPPEKPMTPVGPASCTTGVAYLYKVMAVHPQSLPMEFQLDWGGTVSNWGNWAASGETATVSHVFDTAGTYATAARACFPTGRTHCRSRLSAYRAGRHAICRYGQRPTRP